MQMYLFQAGVIGANGPDMNGGDEADVVYHEYTHGLSHRLVTYADGIPALNNFQSGMMGEAWSDWYAMDYLNDAGYDHDTSAIGDVQIGFFASGGSTIRSEPMDCPADGNANTYCTGGSTGHAGGYTYGDMSHITSGPEVHADGEIWGQTLWQIRQLLGSAVAEKLITQGMMLSPPNPSFLDMRNAILQADLASFGGSHQTTLWGVFANRGMGYFADTAGGNDTTPQESLATPPTCPGQCTSVTGAITDDESGAPVAGVRVGVRGHDSGFTGDLAATTNGTGHFTIANVPKGHSYVLEVNKAGYIPETVNLAVGGGATNANVKVTRDWAASSGGAKVTSFTQPDYTSYGCGPANVIDLSLDSGWGSDSTSNNSNGPAGPRSVVVHLPHAVDVDQLLIDPGATCGDPASAAVSRFTIQTRTSASAPWVTAWNYTGSGLPQGKLSGVSPGTGKRSVSDVRLTMNANRGNADFMDMSELVVLGSPAAPPSPPNTKITRVKVKKKKATVSFSGSGGSGKLHFKCKLDQAGYKSCSSPTTYKRLKSGKHKVLVKAVDAAGRTDPTPAKARFKVKAAKKKHKHSTIATIGAERPARRNQSAGAPAFQSSSSAQAEMMT